MTLCLTHNTPMTGCLIRIGAKNPDAHHTGRFQQSTPMALTSNRSDAPMIFLVSLIHFFVDT